MGGRLKFEHLYVYFDRALIENIVSLIKVILSDELTALFFAVCSTLLCLFGRYLSNLRLTLGPTLYTVIMDTRIIDYPHSDWSVCTRLGVFNQTQSTTFGLDCD